MAASALTGSNVLVVEDDSLLCKQMAAYLQDQGAEVSRAGSMAQARALLVQASFDFAFLDVRLPDGKGTDLLKDGLFPPSTGVIVMTADGGIEGAVEAMRLGALDYLVKPFDFAQLPLVVGRARRARQTARLDEHRRTAVTRSGEDFFFGQALAPLQRQMEKILAADARVQSHLPPVLIEGETGTGKTTIARLLHHRGPRGSQPLVEMNCSALPDSLAESELFGHERGAFTDARTARIGLFEAAHGGSLFLDELPSLSLPLQAKVLKAVEDHRLRRLGGNKEIPVDVRVIAATHRNLKDLIAQGQFREDLYHRLDLYRLRIPPLRERGEEILRLAELLMEQLCQRHRQRPRAFSTAGRRRLLAYDWPGNVRELAHELERALVFEESGHLNFERLSDWAQGQSRPAGGAEWLNPGFRFPPQGFSLEEANRRLIQLALQQSDENVSAAARLLGVSRDYLRYRLSGQKGTSAPGE